MANESIFPLATTTWNQQPILGVKTPENLLEKYTFFPLFRSFVENYETRSRAEREQLINDPAYKEMLDVLTRQEDAVQNLLEVGALEDAEWIRDNVHVLTKDEVAKNEVYEWLDNYVRTPEGRENLARALVNEAGGADNQINIALGSQQDLAGAAGWAKWDRSYVQLGVDAWKENLRTRNLVLPHELRHTGQQDIPNLSPREWFLYHAGIVEADARLTQFCDGVTEGRNQEAEGYDGSLKDVFEKEILPYRDRFLAHTKFQNWDEFVALKDTDPQTYNQVMGRIKEVQFKAALNKLMTSMAYQSQGSNCQGQNGTGNLPGLYAWTEKMCERQGMRIERIWPQVKKMATGEQEIPGVEGYFDQEGRLTNKGRASFNKIELLSRGYHVESQGEEGTFTMQFFGTRDQEEYVNWNLVKKTSMDGSYVTYTYDENNKKVGETSVDMMRNEVEQIRESTYDDNEHLMQTVLKSPEGEVYSCINYVYDQNGNQIMQTETLPDGRVKRSTECSYDANGHKTMIVEKSAKGRMIGGMEYSYDDRGNRIKTVEKDARNRAVRSKECSYDQYNQELSAVYKDARGNITESYEYSYDAAGHRIREVHRDANDQITYEWSAEEERDLEENLEADQQSSAVAMDNVSENVATTEPPKQEYERQLGNGKGIDDKLDALQQEEHEAQNAQQIQPDTKQYGNGKGIDDKIGKLQEDQTKNKQKNQQMHSENLQHI